MDQLKLLIVDDEPNARNALSAILKDEGHRVEEAADGVEGLERLATFQPDIVLTDIQMPRKDGLEFLVDAKRSGTGASFLMMTAFSSIDVAAEAIRAGADDFLLKPLEVESVLRALARVQAKRRLAREAMEIEKRLHERYGSGC